MLPPPPPPLPPVELGDDPDAVNGEAGMDGSDDDRISRCEPEDVRVIRRVRLLPPVAIAYSSRVDGGSALVLTILLRLVKEDDRDDRVTRGDDETGGTNNVLGGDDVGCVAPF